MRRLITFLYLLIQRMATRLSHKPGMPREFALQCCQIPIDIKIFPESVSGGVNLYSVCVCVRIVHEIHQDYISEPLTGRTGPPFNRRTVS